MAMNSNIKVGVTVTLLGILGIVFLLWLSNFDPRQKFYPLQGNFTNVGGLIPGSKVYLMGVKIGQVTATIPDLNKVKVMMEIEDNVKIPVNTRLAIASKGLVGDKSVEFFINDDKIPTQFYKSGAVLDGNSPASFEDLIVEGRKAMQKANALIGDPELNRNIRLTSKNVETFTRKLNTSIGQLDGVVADVKKISASANGFVGKTDLVVAEVNGFIKDLRGATSYNRRNIDSIIANADKISASLNRTANSLNSLVEDPENKNQIKQTVETIKRAALNVEKISQNATFISSDIRGITGDKALKEDLKSIVDNTKTISGTFANTLSNPGIPGLNNKDKTKDEKIDKKDRLNLEFRSEILGQVGYQFKPNTSPSFTVVGNFNVLAHTGFQAFPFVQLGIEEIGGRNQFNAQAGFYPLDNLRVRMGIVRSKLGIGANYMIDQTKSDVIAELYDIGSPHVRLGILQNIYKDYGVSFYWDNQFMTNTNEFNLGVRWQPSIF